MNINYPFSKIEGAWNEDGNPIIDTITIWLKLENISILILKGKGENIWDEYAHRIPSPIDDASTGDIACDSYHKYEEDVDLLKNMGVSILV